MSVVYFDTIELIPVIIEDRGWDGVEDLVRVKL